MLKKQNYSYHNHTYRCGHAIGVEEQYIESAIEEGITHLGISDHCPFKGIHMPTDRMDMEELENYLSTINTLKERYADRIKIYVGFEVEYIRERIDEIKALYDKCDYLLIGQHNKDLRPVQSEEYTFYCSDSDVLYYANQVCEAMETDLFASLNHPEYFMLGRKCWSPACDEAARMICECAKRCDIPLEINLKGLRKSKHYYKDGEFYPYPYRKFFEIAAEYGNKLIIGHDAHSPLDFEDSQELEKASKILEGLDLNILESFDIEAYKVVKKKSV